ncbi:hypothetical protein [Paenibacillus beijingensis]|uniref:Uncharacterized protein n=1 Tax=Paenibacillus beijingensis TaxID=1126833 RepID=A0A0D5NQL5_9BACL|nr:hypothetical protein [Paenibacillus beijingensis]AJY77198.1 hypothetical protein VN24_24890 [Paenibacillus beijingensis]
MKFGGFLLGTLCGAAAVFYVASRKPGMTALAGAAAGKMWTNMGKGMMLGVSTRGVSGKTAGKPDTAAAASDHKEAWSSIESIVSSDPEVKRETEKILAESGSGSRSAH